MSFLKAFIAPSRTGDAWFFAGFTSSYPNITNSGSTVLSNRLPCKGNDIPGCKVFRVPTINSSLVAEVKLEDVVLAELSEQVLVFQFQSEFHAVDHVRFISDFIHIGNIKKISTNAEAELSTFFISAFTGNTIRHRGLWRPVKCRTEVSETRLVF